MSHFDKPLTQWNKPDGSLLTAGDLAVNEALHSILTTARPDFGWLSEEGPADETRMQKSLCWILDPIDGTRSFASARHEWCIGLCLAQNGKPMISGVLHPSAHKLFLAERGKGTTLNGASIRVTDGTHLLGASLAARGGARKRVEGTGLEAIDVIHTPQIARLAMLATGDVDTVLSFGWKHDWDLAPGALLVTEAGGLVSDEHGHEMIFNGSRAEQFGLIAAGPQRHAAVMKFMEKA
jgi:myo-inositol-1(or 4)-monophosphatase